MTKQDTLMIGVLNALIRKAKAINDLVTERAIRDFADHYSIELEEMEK